MIVWMTSMVIGTGRRSSEWVSTIYMNPIMVEINLCTARSLARLYINATTTLKEIEGAFNELTAGRDPALIAVWEKESVLPRKNLKGEWESVYRLKADWDERRLYITLLVIWY